VFLRGLTDATRPRSARVPHPAAPNAWVQTIAGRIILLWGWRRMLVAFAAGALSALAFAPFDAVPILFLTMPVLVWLLDGAEGTSGVGLVRRLIPAAAVGW